MNKSELKNFAISARRDLLEKVSLRAKLFGIDNKSELHIEEKFGQIVANGQSYPSTMKHAIESIQRELHAKGYEQLIEEVAYTWFNRIIAIRYMEVNKYLPERVNVLSSSTGKAEPDIILQYESMDLDIDVVEIADLIRNGENEKAYRKLFIAQCNALNKTLPFLFEKINDYTELLLPDFLLDQESVVRKLVNEISDSNFFIFDESDIKRDNVEVFGWLYQYYMAEKKEEVGGLRNNSVKKEYLPIVTQLFTPKWIVQYMVQNSLGKLYDEKYEGNHLAINWEYYLKHQENQKLYSSFSTLEELKLIDPACGSGHILVYAFDMLYDMYETAGYLARDIPLLILKNNLYGLDIDKRAQQIANFALIMKAVEKQPRLLSRLAKQNQNFSMNIYEIIDSGVHISNKAIDMFSNSTKEIEQINILQDLFENGKQFGSLIVPSELPYNEWINRVNLLDNKENDLIEQGYVNELKEMLIPLLQQGLLLSQKYDVVVTNPPYHNKFNPVLKKFMNKEYNDYKSDLYSAFIYRTTQMTKENGHTALMTPFTWMFIASNERLRKFIINDKTFSSFIQLEYSSFEEATVPICTFVIHNQVKYTNGIYIKLSDFKGDQALKVREAIKLDLKSDYIYNTDSKIFNSFPGNPIAFWTSEQIRKIFTRYEGLSNVAKPLQGLATTNNDLFLRAWYEVEFNKVGIGYSSRLDFTASGKKWAPFNKGGAFRKWYGNNQFLINWDKDGQVLCDYMDNRPEEKVGSKGRVINRKYYFKEGITWSAISSSRLSLRYSPEGFIPSNAGMMLFAKTQSYLFYILGLLNSKVVGKITGMLSSTINFDQGILARLPVVHMEEVENIAELIELIKSNINISKNDWDSYETSWDFKRHPFLAFCENSSFLIDVFKKWALYKQTHFTLLKTNEEQVNKIFIDLYDLQDELTPDLQDENNSLHKADRVYDTKSFLSYFIGCTMGRYSLDIDKLAYAGGGWDESNHITFKPNKFGLILLTDERYFNDDIISRLREFLSIIFGKETVEGNLDWIAESLTKKEIESSEERIRRYFIDEFFKDHLKFYKKRPIYWLVDSGRQKGLRTLVYVHRYQSDTMATIRFEHLQEIQAKYHNEMTTIDTRLINMNLNASEKRDLEGKKSEYRKRLEELLGFDKKLASYANSKIEIDLDDGVKVNYAKFDEILSKI